jgi:hypothetical protein
MPIYANIAVFAVPAAIALLLGLILTQMASTRTGLAAVNSRLDTHDGLISGGAGGAADRLKALEDSAAAGKTTLERVAQRLAELEGLAKTDVSRVGFVRYDAFEDTGSDLSYALALLNREGDGVVLTSIYSRTDTRTYGKAVKSFTPAANASDEELRAIALARNSAP